MLDRMTRTMASVWRWHVQEPALRWLHATKGGACVDIVGWQIPDGMLASDSVCLCGGVGEDIRLELGIIERFGSRVFAFDPTPRAIRYIEGLNYDPDHLTFVPRGLWSEDKTLRFYAPSDSSHVSHSIVTREGGEGFFDASCWTVKTAMQELGVNSIGLLKLNIEGAEYDVLARMLTDDIYPQAIVVAFEGAGSFRKSFAWVRKLSRHGYALAAYRKWAFSFVRNNG